MLDGAPQADYLIDAGEANCTRLILLIFDQIKVMHPQQILEVVGYDSSAAVDIMAWCRQTHNPLVYMYGGTSRETPTHYFILKAGEGLRPMA